MFWWLALATFSWLDLIAKIACFAHIGKFLNVLSFPSNICDYSLSSLSEPLSKSQCSHTNPHILHILYPPSPIFKKRYGFYFFLNMCYTSCSIPLGLCVFVVYLIVEYGYLISDGFGVYCWCFCSDSPCSACIMSWLRHTHTHTHTHWHDSNLIPMKLGLYLSFLIWGHLVLIKHVVLCGSSCTFV